MFKKIVAFILLICLCAPMFALDMSKAEPYDEAEFPKWSINLRRSEIIFFGALPVSYTLTNIATEIMKKDMTFGEKLAISAAAAGGFVLLDIIIGLINKDYS